MGALEPADLADKNQLDSLIVKLNAALADYDEFVSGDALNSTPTTKIKLGTTTLFNLFIGKRVLGRDTSDDRSKVPVYSANVSEPMVFIEHSNIKTFDYPVILWGIDGNFEFNLIQPQVTFATTDHCGAILILDPSIVPEYLLYTLSLRRVEETFDRSFRPSLANMRQFTIAVPIRLDGSFDVEAQKTIAARFTGVREKRENLEAIKTELDSIFTGYIQRARLS